MKLKDSLKLSLNNILHRQLRAWLTLLGIIIGVAAFVSIVSIGEGATQSVAENVSGFGADILTITAGSSKAGFFGGEMRGPPGMDTQNSSTSSSTKTPELKKLDSAVIKGNNNISYVNEIVSGRGELVFLAEKMNVTIEGVNPVTWTELDNVELESGRFFTASDSSVIVIGGNLANDSFDQEITLGRRVVIEDQTFTVVGILTEGRTVYMTQTDAWNVTDTNINVFSSIEAKVKNTDEIETTIDELTSALRLSRRVTEKTQDFSINSSITMQEQVNDMLDTLTLFLAAIAAVSLLVGAIGIANSLFTSVLEKTKEIGILKALGSTEMEILELFLFESALFGLVGGITGIILGLIASYVLSVFVSLNTYVSIELMAISLLLSVGIGVVAGLIPAKSASKLRPIEALRYE
ncbi:MAG: ABC transporter permease [Candidatus Diapherotrites archaeon]